MYLDFAELQAINRRPMYMQDWISKLDDFLRLSEREILNDAGKITHKQAIDKVHGEYEKFRNLIADEPSLAEQHFAEAIQMVKRLEKSRVKKPQQKKSKEN